MKNILYFIFYMLLFSSLGLGIGGLFLWIEVPKYFRKKSLKSQNEKKPKKGKKVKVRNWLRGMLFKIENGFWYLFTFIILPVVCTAVAWSHWMDVPTLITGRYPIEEGIVTKAEKVTGRSTWSYISVVVNNNNYKLVDDNSIIVEDKKLTLLDDKSKFVTKGSSVTIHYLPRTKIIREITVMNNERVVEE